MARFDAALRKLWQVVMSSQKVAEVLEGTNAQRKAHLQLTQARYQPPR